MAMTSSPQSTMSWAVYEWTGRDWVLWHIAPSERVAREVRDALKRFTRQRFYLYAVRPSKPPDPWEVVVRPSGRPGRTWGFAAGRWHAWQVRDALARDVGDAIRARRRALFKPYEFAIRAPEGRYEYSSESDWSPYSY